MNGLSLIQYDILLSLPLVLFGRLYYFRLIRQRQIKKAWQWYAIIVFLHEASHWLAAKLTFQRVQRFVCHAPRSEDDADYAVVWVHTKPVVSILFYLAPLFFPWQILWIIPAIYPYYDQGALSQFFLHAAAVLLSYVTLSASIPSKFDWLQAFRASRWILAGGALFGMFAIANPDRSLLFSSETKPGPKVSKQIKKHGVIVKHKKRQP